MKKTIVIVILAVYIASIAVVNFFGLEIKVFDGITYVDQILCESITVQNQNPVTLEPKQQLDDGTLVFRYEFVPAPDGGEYTMENESIMSNPNAVRINYEVFPHLADETGVRFEFDEKAIEGIAVFHELSRTFVFLQPGGITVTIKAIDGSNTSTTIAIIGRIPKNTNSTN